MFPGQRFGNSNQLIMLLQMPHQSGSQRLTVSFGGSIVVHKLRGLRSIRLPQHSLHRTKVQERFAKVGEKLIAFKAAIRIMVHAR